MNKQSFVILFSLVCLTMLFFSSKGVNAQTSLDFKEPIKTDIEVAEDYNSILDYADVVVCESYYEDEITCLKEKDLYQYIYIDEPLGDVPNEDVEKRTYNTRVFNDGTYRIYAGQPFIKVEDNWYRTEYAYTEKQTLDTLQLEEVQKLNFNMERLNPFGFYTANAQSTYYSGAGDGYSLAYNNSSYSSARSDTTGDETNYTNDTFTLFDGKNSNNYWYSCRGFIPIDTSAIEGTISEASFFIYYVSQTDAVGDDGQKEINLVGSSFEGTVLTNGDFDSITLDSDTEFSTRVPLDSMTPGSYYEFVLNNDGINWIDDEGTTGFAIRTEYDLDDTTTNYLTYPTFRTSEYTGTANDPYLEVTTSTGTGTTTEETATTTYSLPCEFEYSTDLTIITGCSEIYGDASSTSPTETRYFYFHIPFIFWIIIFAITFPLLLRFGLELIITWRR